MPSHLKKHREETSRIQFPRWDNNLFSQPNKSLLSRTSAPKHAAVNIPKEKATKYQMTTKKVQRKSPTKRQQQERRSEKVARRVSPRQQQKQQQRRKSPESKPRQLTQEELDDIEWEKREKRHTLPRRAESGIVRRSNRSQSIDNYEDYLRTEEEKYLASLKILRDNDRSHQKKKRNVSNAQRLPRIVRQATPNTPITGNSAITKESSGFSSIPQLLMPEFSRTDGFSSARSNVSTSSNTSDLSRTSSKISNFSDGQAATIENMVERLCSDRYDDSNQNLVYGEIVKSECSSTCSSCSTVSRNSTDKVWVKDFKKLDRLVKKKEKNDRKIQKQMNQEYWARRMGRYDEEPEEMPDKPKEKPTLLRSLSTIIRRLNCAADTERYVM